MKALLALVALGLTFGLQPAAAQDPRAPDWTSQQLPEWTRAPLHDSAFVARYSISTFLNPFFQAGDFDRDGLGDVAILITERATGKRGIAMLRHSRTAPVILGAGTAFGNGDDDFKWLGIWRLEPRGRANDLYLEAPESASGIVRWTGTHFTWLQRAD